MDISYDNENAKECFKCEQKVINNLYIACNTSNNTIILWNQFQIFIYENLQLESAAIRLNPSFQIHNLIISSNYLVCLDLSGNIHTISIKFKNTTSNSFKFGFQPREIGIVASTLYEHDHALSLKYESNSYFLYLHKIHTEFVLVKKVIFVHTENLPIIQTKDKYILAVQSIPENNLESLEKVFNPENVHIRNKYALTIVTFDKLNIYGCLFSPSITEEQITLVKLYTCPSEICSIHIVTESQDIKIIITLNIGTVIILPVNEIKTPQIIHLNIAIYKSLIFEDSILYTDGKSMWIAHNFMSKDRKFRQFFLKHVKDFTKLGDQVICTTYMDLIYKFLIDDNGSYLKSESIDEYCSAEKLLNNSEYLTKIMEEVEKNDTLIKSLTKEKDYITAISLSNRQDIMDNVIKHKVIVYQSYEDAIAENKTTFLTNHVYEYFDKESFFFLVKINTTTEHKLSDILSNALGDLRIHITLATSSKVLKTTSIKVNELIKISFLIPLKTKVLDYTEMNVDIKIISNIPGALDPKQKIWTILYRHLVTLHSEHFIKFNLNSNMQLCMKILEEPLEKLMLQTATNHYGNLFEFHDLLKLKPASKEWQMYVRLPDNYQDIFRNKELMQHVTSKKVNYFLQQLTSEELLKSKSNLVFSIGNDKVKIEIYNDSFSNPLLKISSTNLNIVLNMRNFLSDLICCVFTNLSPAKEFINLSFYAAVENLQKAVKRSITSSSEEEIEPLVEQFERNVIGLLPI